MREEKYDLAKALAIYFVVFGHVLAQAGYKNLHMVIFSYMPVFFFISGYFLYHSVNKYKFKVFFLKKLKTLFIPYLIWSAISFFLNILLLLLHRKWNIQNIAKEFINIFLYARSTWFFIILFISSIFLAAFAYLIKNKYWKLLCIVAWIIVSLQPVDDLFMLFKFKWLFPFMMLGYCISEYKPNFLYANSLSWLKCILYIGIFIILSNVFYNESFFLGYSKFDYCTILEAIVGIIYYIISTIGIISYIIVSQKLLNYNLGHKLKCIGQSTADIYVIHMFLVKILVLEIHYETIAYIYAFIQSAIIVFASLLIKYILRNSKLYQYSLGK